MSQLDKETLVENLNSIFNSQAFISYYKMNSQNVRYEILKKVIEFGIIIQDYTDFWNYSSVGNYLENVERLSDKEIREIFLNKFIKEGYLFHIMPAKNETEVLKNGLLTPFSRGITINKAEELAQFSKYLHDKYRDYFPLLIANENFNNSNKTNRYNNIYFGFDLKYLLQTYGSSSELSKFIKMTLELRFNLDFQEKNKSEMILLLVNKLIKDSVLSKEEIRKIIELLEPFIEQEDYSKDIVLFPYKKLISTDELFNMAKKNNNIDFFEEMTVTSLLYDNGIHHEFTHCEDIPPEDLIIVTSGQKPEAKLGGVYQKNIVK